MDEVQELLDRHTKQENERFSEINKQLSLMRENHLKHMETDIQSLKVQGAVLTADMSWVKWGIYLILGTLISGTLSLIFIKYAQ